MQHIAITPGEPAGVGPELLVRYIQHAPTIPNIKLVAVASKALLYQFAEQLNLPLTLVDYHPNDEHPQKPCELCVIDVPLQCAVTIGELRTENARYVLKTLERATDLCRASKIDALVTGPVQKSVLNDADIAFTGHTEFLADRCGVPRVVMMLATEGLRVALATTHIPLSSVASTITPQLLHECCVILHRDLQVQFGIEQPRILVCGLNPHAGEGGHLGREEIEIIEPTLAKLRAQGLAFAGPLPADTLFTPHHLEQADAVLAMYHDQGLPVLKHKGFGQAVNITLGLPFIRTSVDHGTALDLAGKGSANLGSFNTALNYAVNMLKPRTAR